MSRIQRLGIGNGGVDCQISYMQGKKYPNAGEIVKPVQGVTNKTLLKNPYNTINEPIAKPGQRPLRITTDNRGNVFARSETMLVPGVTNNNLLKNPYNILEEPVPEKATLSLQRIKDINNKSLPDYVTENRGINEVMLQVLTMISDKPVKLITIQLLKILITKNGAVYPEQNQQKILLALQFFDAVLTEGRKVFRENTLSPTKIPEMLQPAVDVYVKEIKKIYPGLKEIAGKTDAEIQTGLAELALLSNALTRMFEYNNAIDPSNTLTREQIMASSLSGNVLTGDDSAAKEQVFDNIDKMPLKVFTDFFNNEENKKIIAAIDKQKADVDKPNVMSLFNLLMYLDKAEKADPVDASNLANAKEDLKEEISKPGNQKAYKDGLVELKVDDDKDLANFSKDMQPFFFPQGGSGRKVMSGSGKPHLRKVNQVYHQVGRSNPKYQAY